jgi:hypothetical protein
LDSSGAKIPIWHIPPERAEQARKDPKRNRNFPTKWLHADPAKPGYEFMSRKLTICNEKSLFVAHQSPTKAEGFAEPPEKAHKAPETRYRWRNFDRGNCHDR